MLPLEVFEPGKRPASGVSRIARTVVCAGALWTAACDHPVIQRTQAATVPKTTADITGKREVRATGSIQAIRSYSIPTPQIAGSGGRLTLTRIASNGAQVSEGDVIAEFDRTAQLDAALQAKAKFDDLSHQVDQRLAQNQSDAEKRASDLQKAEGDLAKAELELRKGPLLSEIDRLKNEAKAEDARAHVASLRKSGQFHDQADAAALRVLELQRDRQKVALERAQRNSERLQVHAPLAGMIALENIWKMGSMGHAQEGDQLWNGQVLMHIFDPTEMEVRAKVAEPDDAALIPGARAQITLDAYPDLTFQAHFYSASPVATSALDSPIKTFAATFRLEKGDPHLLPDLSAAVVIEPPEGDSKR